MDGVNGVSGADATRINEYLAGIYEPSAQGYDISAIVDENPELSGSDATCILYLEAGMIERAGNAGLYGKFYVDEEGFYILSGELYE